MFNNVIVNVRKTLPFARNIGQGNSCPVECEYADIACRAGEDRATTLPKPHRVKESKKKKKVINNMSKKLD